MAGCLIAFINKDSDKANELATEVLDNFSVDTNQRILDQMCRKIGISGSKKENHTLLRNFLKIMLKNQSDYTITFRALPQVLLGDSDDLFDQFKEKAELHSWLEDWQQTVRAENEDINLLVNDLNEINPAYIPRNHQIQDVIDLAYENNFSKMLEMIEVVQDPFKEKDKYSSYMNAPSEDQKVKRTFCGT